jgi:phosphonate transport system substrate-binding protein
MSSPRFRGVVVLAALVLLSALPAAAKTPIRIGHREKRGEVSKAREFGPFLAWLNQSPAYEYTIEVFDTVEQLEAAFISNRVDVALLGPLAYVRLHSATGAYPVVAEGQTYRSVIIVRKDSPVQKLSDLKGKTFAFGYEESTSSHLFPLLMLVKAGVKEADLGAHAFVGGHSQVVDAVASGKYEAGGLIEGEYERNKDKVRLLSTSSPIPGVPLVVHRNAEAKWLADFRKSLLAYKPASKDPAFAFASGLTPVTDEDYSPVRSVAHIVLGKDYRSK